MTLIRFLQKTNFLKELVYRVSFSRAKKIIRQIGPDLKKGNKILDIGSGTCAVCEILQSKGYETTPLDVADLSFNKNIKPILYDGEKIPFADNKFDVSLIITVLHHSSNPRKILKEAQRVSKKIIVVEDIYRNSLHKFLTYFFDSILSLHFLNHPHNNKDDKEWKKTFKDLRFKLIKAKYMRVFLVFDLAIYHLEK